MNTSLQSSSSIESGSSEIDIPFFSKLDRRSGSTDLRACIDLTSSKDEVELHDIRDSLEYLSPVRTTTFKNYDVPTEDEWQLRRKNMNLGLVPRLPS